MFKSELLRLLAPCGDDEEVFVYVMGDEGQVLPIEDVGYSPLEIGRTEDDHVEPYWHITAVVAGDAHA